MEFDKEHLSLIVETAMNRAMKPIQDEITANAMQIQELRSEHSLKIQELQQTTFGVTGNNGLRLDAESSKREIQKIKDSMIDIEEFKIVKFDVNEIKTAQTKIFAYSSAAASFIALAGALFGEKVKRVMGL